MDLLILSQVSTAPAISFGDIILAVTFVVIILYTYYTYKLAKISVVYPAMLHARKKHTEDLKKFLSELEYIIKQYPCYDEAPKEERPINPITQKRMDWRFKDLLNNHLPEKCEGLFKDECKQFERNLNIYNKHRNKLYNEIRKNIIVYLKESELEEEWYTSIRSRRIDDFAMLCYKQYLNYFKSEKSMYYKPSRENFKTDNPFEDLIEIKFYEGGDEFVVAHRYIKDIPTPLTSSKIDNYSAPIIEIYKNMLFNEAEIIKYERLSIEIISIYNEMKDHEKHLKISIDYLNRYPLLRGTKCPILKDLYKDNDLRDF